MHLNKYQEQALEYKVPHSPPEERVMGLLEEAGEVAGLFKRLLRGDYTPEEVGPRLLKELGDILWYVSGVANDNGWTLQQVAEANIDKLAARRLKNNIIGSGSDR